MTKEESARREILASAKTLLIEYGYNKSTMEDIARRARKGKSTVYYYFTNKEEIFFMVVDHEIKALYQELETEIGKKQSAFDKLHTLLKLLLQKLCENPILSSLVNDNIDSKVLKELAVRLRVKYGTEHRKIVEEIILYGIGRGEFPLQSNEQIVVITDLMNCIIKGVSLELYENRYTIEYGERMIDLFINMIIVHLKQ